MELSQYKALEQIAIERNYGRGKEHSYQVKRLALGIYDELNRLGILDIREGEKVIEAAALLHDIGWPQEPHNESAFDILTTEIPKRLQSEPLSEQELSAILYCVLWHRDDKFPKRGDVEIVNPSHIEKLASIIRVADALDHGLHQRVDKVRLELNDNRLIFKVIAHKDICDELGRAKEKSDLLKKAFNLEEVKFIHANT